MLVAELLMKDVLALRADMKESAAELATGAVPDPGGAWPPAAAAVAPPPSPSRATGSKAWWDGACATAMARGCRELELRCRAVAMILSACTPSS